MPKQTFNYKYDDLFNPLLEAIQKLGGSASISEIEDEVTTILNLSEEEVNDIHKGSSTKLSYRLAWARYYLKKYGLIENSTRGIWALKSDSLQNFGVDKDEVKKVVKELHMKNKKLTDILEEDFSGDEDNDISWQEELLLILQSIKPDQFERLCKRLLRETGFVNVEVTGKSGDGGIDGKGVLKIQGLLSFHIVFQCKRYKGSVSCNTIWDFRGAMAGRAEKGLVITTGTFTRDAKKEAQREGAAPIDLVDGIELTNMLKEMRLGVGVEMVERVSLQKEWFEGI